MGLYEPDTDTNCQEEYMSTRDYNGGILPPVFLPIVRKHICGLEIMMEEYCLQFLYFHIAPFIGYSNADLIYSMETCTNKQCNSIYFQHFSACIRK
jgi:hypothetical protein